MHLKNDEKLLFLLSFESNFLPWKARSNLNMHLNFIKISNLIVGILKVDVIGHYSKKLWAIRVTN